jgi:branched-subunit amino acid permease
MSPQTIVGIMLLVIGVILVFVGMNASNSIADQVSNTFTGRFTERTTWYIIGGIASAVLGLLLVFIRSRGKLA